MHAACARTVRLRASCRVPSLRITQHDRSPSRLAGSSAPALDAARCGTLDQARRRALSQAGRWDGRHQKQQGFDSRGDLTRLGEFVRTLHDDRLSVGLFIPFEQAWNAVKEFIETDGALPTCIAWIASRDLPPETFPGS
jgi:hypothetical protein